MATRPPCPCRLWTRDAVAVTEPPPCQWRAVAITTTITRRPRHWAPCPRGLDERAACNSTASDCPRCRPLRPRPCPRRDPQETGEHLFKIPFFVVLLPSSFGVSYCPTLLINASYIVVFPRKGKRYKVTRGIRMTGSLRFVCLRDERMGV